MKTNTNPHFIPGDIIDLASLATRLKQAVNGAVHYLAGLLSQGTRHLIATCGEDGSVDPALAQELSRDFAAIINGVPIYNPDHFAEVKLSSRTRKLLQSQPKGPTLARCHRLLLEDVFHDEIAQRYHEKRQQQWINLKGGLRRLKGAKGIHGRVKIKGKEYREFFPTDDLDEARQKFHTWVSELRQSLKETCGVKESLASFVEPYLASRQKEVALHQIKPRTIPDLRKVFNAIGQHWRGFATISLARILTPRSIEGIGTFLLTKAKNLTHRGKTLSPATYNTYMSAIALLLGYLKYQEKISEELYLKLKARIKYAKVPPRKVPIPTADQLRQMRARLYRVRQGMSRGETGPKFDVYMLSGQRKATVNAMMVEHFDFAKSEVFLTHLKGHAGDPTEEWRPMVPELAEIVQRYIQARGLKEGDRLWTTTRNNNAFRAAAKAVGLGNWYHQACRKWFGTTGLKESKDPLAIADLMCHRDGGKTLLAVYRQLCTEHLQATTSTLKLYPGAITGKSLESATARAEKVMKRILASPQETVVRALDCILWMEAKLDGRDYTALDQLPRLGQEHPPIYTPKPAPAANGPHPTVVKINLKFLIQRKGVYHSDVAAATGLRRSVIDRASKIGELQAHYLPALCKYFEVSIEEFLFCDLSATSVPGNQAHVPEPTETPTTGKPENVGEPVRELTLEDLVTKQDPAALLKVVARNLNSLVFERNLTVNALAQAADLSHSVLARSLHEQFMPTNASLHKLAQALGVKATEIVDPARKNLVINRPIVIGNLNALVNHSGLAPTTFFVRLKLDARCMLEVLKTGEISSAQAHRIVDASGGVFSLRELVSEDLSARLPAAPQIVAAVVSRNLGSLCWERGMYPAEIARKAGVSLCTGINYAEGRSRRMDRGLLTKVALALDLTLAELVDPLRPVVEVTSYFKNNLQHLLDRSGLSLTPFAERCGLDPRALNSLLAGEAPNPHQFQKLVIKLNIKPADLLTRDLRQTPTGEGTPQGSGTAAASQEQAEQKREEPARQTFTPQAYATVPTNSKEQIAGQK